MSDTAEYIQRWEATQQRHDALRQPWQVKPIATQELQLYVGWLEDVLKRCDDASSRCKLRAMLWALRDHIPPELRRTTNV